MLQFPQISKWLHFDEHSLARVAFVVGLLGGWVFLWAGPWPSWIEGWTLGRLIVAVGVFALPGVFLQSLIASPAPARLSQHLVVGFAISIALTGFLGLAAKAIHLPFRFVMSGLFVLGTASLLGLALTGRLSLQIRLKPADLAPRLLAAVPFLLALVLAGRLALPSRYTADNASYGAYATAIRASERLDFKEPIFGMGHQANVRFWFSFWPMVEAVVAELGDVHTLHVVGYHFAPILAVLAMLAVFELARSLGLSPRLAYLAVIAQLVSLQFLYEKSQAGEAFFWRMAEDKVVAGFLLAPVVLGLLVRYLDAPRRTTLSLLGLSMWAIGFTHPTLAGMVAAVAGLYTLVNLVLNRNFKAATLVLLVLVLPLLLQFSPRFVASAPDGWQVAGFEPVDFSVENQRTVNRRLNVYEGRLIYGINPRLVMELPFFVAAISGVVALVGLRKSQAARLIVAATLLVVFVLIPYTGWILGLAVTAFQLWRVPWLTPFGISAAYLVGLIIRALAGPPFRLKWSQMRLLRAAVPLAQVSLLAGMFLALRAIDEADRVFAIPYSVTQEIRQEVDAYVEIGHQLDDLIDEHAVAIGDDEVSNWTLASMSAKAKLLVFRKAIHTQYIGGFTPEQASARFRAWRRMVDVSTKDQKRLDFYDAWKVRFILANDPDSRELMAKLARTYPDNLSLVASSGRLELYEFTPTQ